MAQDCSRNGDGSRSDGVERKGVLPFSVCKNENASEDSINLELPRAWGLKKKKYRENMTWRTKKKKQMMKKKKARPAG